MKWIRPWGLVLFLALIVAPVLAVVLLADWAVQRAVETWGTQMNKAKVELDGAKISFAPFGFDLNNLQVTDSGAPMRNAVQVDRIRFAVDLYPLLRRKLVITDMSLEGVRTNTERASSGAVELPVEPEPAPEPKESGFEFPAIDMPELKDLVDAGSLRTNQLIEQYRTGIEAAEGQWKARLNELPEASALAQYEQRIAQAKPSLKGNTLQDAKEIADAVKRLEVVRDDIRKDVDRINTARRAASDDWTTWSNNMRELLAAPGADLDQLKGKYSLDTKGLSNASRALFGAQAAQWATTARVWYEKIKPYVASGPEAKEPERKRMKGIDVRFAERDQLPDFLIRSMKLSVSVKAGDLGGEIRNVTHDQPTLGHPLTFSFFGEKLQGVQDIEIEGTLNHVVPRAAHDRMQIKAHGIAIEKYDIARGGGFPLTLQNAEVDFDAFAELKETALLNAGLTFDFKKAQLVADVQSEGGELGQVVANALADIKRFGVTAKFSGTLRDYDVDLRSDLDDALRTALNRQFKQRVDAWLADAKSKLDAKVNDARKKIDAKLEGLRAAEKQIEQRRAQAEAALKKAEDELRAATEKARSDTKDKAQDKLKDTAGKLKDKLKF